eukprot:2874586-Pleurochrysis_carterae.AAC.1
MQTKKRRNAESAPCHRQATSKQGSSMMKHAAATISIRHASIHIAVRRVPRVGLHAHRLRVDLMKKPCRSS